MLYLDAKLVHYILFAEKAVMCAAQDLVFISPLTIVPGSNCWHGNYVKFKMVVMVETCGGLMVIFWLSSIYI